MASEQIGRRAVAVSASGNCRYRGRIIGAVAAWLAFIASAALVWSMLVYI
jgi:hypothetical protein